MRTAQVTRKDLKIHFKELSPSIPSLSSSNTGLIDNMDFLPIVRLLSRVNCEQAIKGLTV